MFYVVKSKSLVRGVFFACLFVHIIMLRARKLKNSVIFPVVLGFWIVSYVNWGGVKLLFLDRD